MKKIVILLVFLITSLILCVNVKAEESDEYEYDAPDLVAINNQTGVHYANFNGLSVHMVDHKNYNTFVGVKLTNLKTHDFTKYNALMIRFENGSSASLDVRVAYNHNVGDSNYGNRVEKDPSPIYTLNENGNVVYYAGEERTSSSHTTAFHTIKAPFNGWLILKIEDTNATDLTQLQNVDSISIYGNQGKMWWGKWNIGNLYLTNVEFPEDVSSVGGTIGSKKLAWEVDFNKANYTKEFYNWILGSTEYIDTTFIVAPVHEKEFNVTTSYLVTDEEYESNLNQMFKIKFPEELMNKHGMFDLSNLGGILFDANNTSAKPFEFSIRFTRFRTEWVTSKDSSIYLIPEEGYGYWAPSNFIPAGFKGKVFVPYSNDLFVSYSEENSAESVPEFTYNTYAQFVVRIRDTQNSGVHCYISDFKYTSKDYATSLYEVDATISGTGNYEINGLKNYTVSNDVSLEKAIGMKLNVKNNGAKANLNISVFETKLENNALDPIEVPEAFDGSLYVPFDGIASSTGNNRVDGKLSKLVFDGSNMVVKGFSIVYQDGTESDVISSLEESVKYNISLENGSGGEASISKTDAFEGETVVLSVTPKDGYRVSSIKANSRSVKLTNGKYVLEDIDQDVVFKVSYKKIETEVVEPKPEEKGCGSSIIASIYMFSILGVSAFILKKKKDE